MPDYRLLVFDWDGTLVDSIARIVRTVQQAAAGLGLPPRSDEAVRGIIGLALPEAARVLYPQLSAAQVGRFCEDYSAAYLTPDGEPLLVFPGVAEALQAFRQQGYLLAVATGKSRRGLQQALASVGWQDHFDITRCADETASKPDPRMLHEIMAHCAVPPAAALMVGDSSFDLLMAHSAGVDAVAVGFGAQSLDSLRQHRPRLAIERFSELHGWLAGQLNEVGHV